MRLRGQREPIVKRHPLTGAAIEPIGVVNNKIVWPILGGDSSNDDDDDDDDDDQGGANSSSGGGSTDDKDDDKGSSGSGSEADVISRDEFLKLEARMKAADKRADAAERKIKEAEDAKKDDLTKAQDRIAELEAALEEATNGHRSLRLQNAFLAANKHTWHDPDIALDLAERKGFLEGVTSDDGEVDKPALVKVLDKLAKEHAYLVKEESKKSDEPDGPSGESASGRKGNTKDKAAREKQLKQRFPALNR